MRCLNPRCEADLDNGELYCSPSCANSLLRDPVPPFPQEFAGVPGEPGSPERAAYAEAPARFTRENPGVLDALAAADFRGQPVHVERRVRVLGSARAGMWYADRVGEEFTVREAARGFYVVDNPGGRPSMEYSISADDCEPIEDSVGPFPAEPAFGSPEAVEQAAETIRNFTPGPWRIEDPLGPGILSIVAGPDDPGTWLDIAQVPVEESTTGIDSDTASNNAALLAAAPDLLAEVERLRDAMVQKEAERLDVVAENARFRLTLDVRGRGDAAERKQQDTLAAEVERLRGENERFRLDLVEQAASWHARELEALRQRDAQADALELLLRETEALGGHPAIRRARAIGHLTLRKAGR